MAYEKVLKFGQHKLVMILLKVEMRWILFVVQYRFMNKPFAIKTDGILPIYIERENSLTFAWVYVSTLICTYYFVQYYIISVYTSMLVLCFVQQNHSSLRDIDHKQRDRSRYILYSPN